MAKYQQGFPVNENGEIVTTTGSGSRNITGTLPIDQLSVNNTGECLFAPPQMESWKVVSKSGAAAVVTGTTTETAAVTVTIPAGLMKENSILRVKAFGKISTAADAVNKSYTVRFGGTGGIGTSSQIYAAGDTVTGVISFECSLFNRNSLTSQVAGLRNTFTGTGRTTSQADLVSTSVNTAQDSFVYICLDPANVGDVMSIEAYSVEVLL